jgi:putative ABC transport system permease protein
MQAALVAMLPGGTPADPVVATTFDPRVVAFTIALALVAGLLFGLLPAWRSASRGEAALREFGAALTAGRSGTRTMRALVTIQVAVCLCLLVIAGLLTRSVRNASAFDPGFETSGLVLAEFDPGRHGYDMDRARALFEQLSARLRRYPEVRGISRAIVVPLGGGEERLGYVIPGHRGRNDAPFIGIDTNVVTRDYFTTMGIPVVQGRAFTEADAGAPRGVAVVNETMARRYWGHANPVGQMFATAGRDGQPLEIVGVVKDIKHYSLSEEPRPYVYQLAERTAPAGIIHVRVSGDAGPFVGILSRELAAIDPTIALDQVLTFEQLRRQPLALRYAMATLATTSGGLALLLTVVGIYGTMSNAVGHRAREIGVRMAFGAAKADVIRLVLRDGLLPVGAGIAAGLALGAWVGRLVASELFGVAPGDPGTHAAAIAAVLVAAVIALGFPARRATKVDPSEVLRA